MQTDVNTSAPAVGAGRAFPISTMRRLGAVARLPPARDLRRNAARVKLPGGAWFGPRNPSRSGALEGIWGGQGRALCSAAARPLSAIQGALPAETIARMREDAEGGDATAQYHVGLACYEGKHGFEKDFLQAFEWFKKSADSGAAMAQFKVGCMHLNGEGVPVDKTEAARYFDLAAEQDVPEARFNLGMCYEKGEGVPQDFVLACEQYALSAAKENIEASYRLGLMHLKGTGCRKDNSIAAEMFRMPAAKGGIPEAQFVLGYLSLQGDGVKQSASEGERYLTMAAEQGLHAAQNYLGMVLIKGFVVAKNEGKGLGWLQKAATSGHVKSQFDLFEQLSKGKGMEKEALRWLRAAAEGGMPQAQYRYGQCLQAGDLGVHKNEEEGRGWVRKAEEQGFVPEDAK